MDSITNIRPTGNQSTTSVKQNDHNERAKAVQSDNPRADTVEISSHAKAHTNFTEARNQRAERIQQIRHEIVNHRYETEDRLDATVDRIFAELGSLDIRI